MNSQQWRREWIAEKIIDNLCEIPVVNREIALILMHQLGFFSIRAVADANPERLPPEGIELEKMTLIVEKARNIVGFRDLQSKQEKIRLVENQLSGSKETHLDSILKNLDFERKQDAARRDAIVGPLTTDELLQEIARRIKDNELALFIGSGFSKNISKKEASIPDWKELSSLLIDEITANEADKKRLNEMSLLRVAEIYVQKYSKQKLIQLLENKLDANNEELATSDVFVHLASLNPSRIYTTNYDCFIERAYRNANRRFNPIVNIGDLAKLEQYPGITQVIKLHGSLNCYHSYESNYDDLIITESDYFRRLRERHPFEVLLQADMWSKGFLFIGYSFNDANIGYLWSLLDIYPESAQIKKSYFVILDDNPTFTEFLASKRIMTISLSREGFKDLAQFMKRIAECTVALKFPWQEEFFSRSKLSLFQQPVFITDGEFRDLRDAVASEKNENVFKALRSLEKKVPTNFHFKEYVNLLYEIMRGSFDGEVKSEALNRMAEKIEIFSKDNELFINNSHLYYTSHVSAIAEAFFDPGLYETGAEIFLNASEKIALRYFNVIVEQLIQQMDKMKSPEVFLSAMRKISNHGFIKMGDEKYRNALDVIAQKFSISESDIRKIKNI